MTAPNPPQAPIALPAGRLPAPWFILLMVCACVTSSVLGWMSHDGATAWAITINFVALCAVTGLRFRMPRLRVTGPTGDIDLVAVPDTAGRAQSEQNAA